MGKYLDALRTGLLAVLLAAGGMTALSMTGCEREEGPVEETRETIEETGEEAGEGVEEAGERARDAVD